MTVKDEGMPIFEGKGHGDLFVEFNVVLPNTISDDLRSSTCLALLLRFDPRLIIFLELEHAFAADKQKKDEL
jgi:DnaJ-class molecular chaperone